MFTEEEEEDAFTRPCPGDLSEIKTKDVLRVLQHKRPIMHISLTDIRKIQNLCYIKYGPMAIVFVFDHSLDWKNATR